MSGEDVRECNVNHCAATVLKGKMGIFQILLIMCFSSLVLGGSAVVAINSKASEKAIVALEKSERAEKDMMQIENTIMDIYLQVAEGNLMLKNVNDKLAELKEMIDE